MKKVVLTASILALIACSGNKKTTTKRIVKEVETTVNIAQKYASSITASEMKTSLYIFSSDEFEGRNTGEPGQKKAVKFLKDEYIKMGISSPFGNENYFQNVPKEFLKGVSKNDSENVLAFIEGSEHPEEVLVISAHLDHIGIEDGKIFNGADDNGTGTIALLEMAEAFHMAKKEGNGPKRSILFLHVTGEEHGLYGSRYYAENPVYELKNTIANINVDMIGRSDPSSQI